ncbi:hypothetical protein IPH25_00745 [bacterium]|nr:MAG: hypothetical protein IPG37_02865 [bacterium]QQR61957.1 MAG: hypothetical protein IPH25_00745 [bacterium]QQR62451.1 MAG: hypothetical protein IPH67_03420 [bacterium]
MKKILYGILLSGLTLHNAFGVVGRVIQTDLWKDNIDAIQAALTLVSDKLQEDRSFFGDVKHQLSGLAQIIRDYDKADQDLLQRLLNLYSRYVSVYDQTIKDQDYARQTNIYDIQQLRIALEALIQSTTAQINELTSQSDSLETVRAALESEYNDAIVGSEDEVNSIMNLMRTVYSSYNDMLAQKTHSLNDLTEVLDELNKHVINSTKGLQRVDQEVKSW